MAPAYTKLSVEQNAEEVKTFLEASKYLEDTPEAYASFDWRLHLALSIASKNPIYTLILNGFSGFYEQIARVYFGSVEARQSSQAFYNALLKAAEQGNAVAAERVTRSGMQESLDLWQREPGKCKK
jgi:GntR family negative regulator for fad regulon and positive regulator of fabA